MLGSALDPILLKLWKFCAAIYLLFHLRGGTPGGKARLKSMSPRQQWERPQNPNPSAWNIISIGCTIEKNVPLTQTSSQASIAFVHAPAPITPITGRNLPSAVKIRFPASNITYPGMDKMMILRYSPASMDVCGSGKIYGKKSYAKTHRTAIGIVTAPRSRIILCTCNRASSRLPEPQA